MKKMFILLLVLVAILAAGCTSKDEKTTNAQYSDQTHLKPLISANEVDSQTQNVSARQIIARQEVPTEITAINVPGPYKWMSTDTNDGMTEGTAKFFKDSYITILQGAVKTPSIVNCEDVKICFLTPESGDIISLTKGHIIIYFRTQYSDGLVYEGLAKNSHGDVSLKAGDSFLMYNEGNDGAFEAENFNPLAVFQIRIDKNN